MKKKSDDSVYIQSNSYKQKYVFKRRLKTTICDSGKQKTKNLFPNFYNLNTFQNSTPQIKF